MKYWCLVFGNYHDEDYTEYFDSEENCKKAFEEICEFCKNHKEFERNSYMCSWYDSNWNEFSTVVEMCELSMPEITQRPYSLFFDKAYEKYRAEKEN